MLADIGFNLFIDSIPTHFTPWETCLHLYISLHVKMGFPGGPDGKESACNVGDLGSNPELGRWLGEGNGNPIQYSCLENLMDGGTFCSDGWGYAQQIFNPIFIDGQGGVPLLLFDLRPTYGGSNEDHDDLLKEVTLICIISTIVWSQVKQ